MPTGTFSVTSAPFAPARSRPAPFSPAAGLVVLLVAIVDERVQPVDALDPDVAATPAVAAIRPAELDELLAPERHAAIAAVAGANIDLGLVEEFHGVRRS